MLLTELIGKHIYSGKNLRGTITGVCVSLKSKAVRYLLCQTAPKTARAEFAVSVSSVERIDEVVTLKRLKTLFPKNCSRLFLNRPIYTDEGDYVGYLADAEVDGFTLTGVIVGNGKRYAAACVSALSDAVILKKAPPYPIGQTIPAPYVSIFSKQSATVTRAILKEAIRQKRLVDFTLSLSPFNK